jgi:signal transduction histidine kinase
MRSVTGSDSSRAVALAASVGGAVTLVSLLPVTGVAYRSPALHVAIETAAMFAALLAAVLLMGRYLRKPLLGDLVLAASLLLLGLTNLCFAVVPWSIDEQLGSFDTWAPIAGRLLGAAGLALGALLPDRPVEAPRRAAIRATLAVLALLAALGLLGWALAPHLPAGIDPDVPPDPSGPDLVGEPSVLASQLVGLVLYAAAAAGFMRRAARAGDELMVWLAAASTLAAFSRLNYFLFPSLYSEWVYAGDFLRVAFYAVILAGSLREILAYQRDAAELAVDRERRRIARDLHDGLAQDLAFIVSHARRMPPEAEEPAGRIAEAAERALAESRHAIATLGRPFDAALDISVAQAAEEVGARDGVRLELDLARELPALPAVHDALARIVREAVSNAIRHGGARAVTVRLTRLDGLRLTVEDDGIGVTPADAPGFGLASMRERAQALGGTIEVVRRPEGGTRVEVWVP